MNKIKEFFTDWSWKEKAWLAFVLIVQTVAWAIQKESLFMLVMTYMQILKWMGGNLPFMDSLTTVVSVVASFLYLLRFSEQWAMWAIVNALSIVMWIMVFMQGDSSALLIIIMKTINFINSTYGFLNWRKIAKETA